MDEYYPIIVEGDWGPEHAKGVKNKLQIHFQSKKKSQGGDCVVKYDEGKSATILFKTSESKCEHKRYAVCVYLFKCSQPVEMLPYMLAHCLPKLA